MDSKPPSSSSSFLQQPLVAGSSEATQKVVITQALKPSPQEPGNEINNDIGNGRDDPQRISSPLSSASRKRSLDNNSEDIMMDKASTDKKLENGYGMLSVLVISSNSAISKLDNLDTIQCSLPVYPPPRPPPSLTAVLTGNIIEYCLIRIVLNNQ